ncbi:MAG: hypothetical protein NC548_34090 [Lachnospiraceae bacterium]|nr:hypothetical protein [Lachnospiraceae bacterium]
MKFLTEVTESYRLDTENEVNQLVEEAKHNKLYELVKYSCIQKERKQKGEVIDSWFKVTFTKKFCDEKEPEVQITNISYGGQEDD